MSLGDESYLSKDAVSIHALDDILEIENDTISTISSKSSSSSSSFHSEFVPLSEMVEQAVKSSMETVISAIVTAAHN